MNLYSTEHQKLNFAYVQEILSKFNHKETPYVDFIKDPRPCNVVFFWTDDTQKKRDWVVDGLKWRNQGANKPFPANDPVLFKSYYHLIDKDGLVSKEFTKESFYLKGQDLPVLIHYMGIYDSDVEIESGPHGNIKQKESSQNYMRTLPSVMKELKEQVSQKAPSTVYKSTSKKKGHRDLKQCQNLRFAVNRLKRFTYDEIANIHLMHVSLGFPNLILTAPDVRIIGMDDELIRDLKKTLDIFGSDNRVCFQFDTTFNLTGFYVSILLFIHPILVLHNTEKSPPIPVANAMTRYFPKLPLLRCWNHFYKSTERWINGSKHFTNDDVGFYCESIRELLLQPTKQLFEQQLNNKINRYVNNLGRQFENLAAWSVRPIAKRLFNHFTGITTNQSEGLNNLFKLINNRTELPLDIIVFSLQKLSIYYSNEIKYGFGNRGVYRLRLEYKEMCFVDTRYIRTRDTMEPTQIIKSLIVNKDELLRTAGVKFTTVSDSSEASDTDSDVDTETDIETNGPNSEVESQIEIINEIDLISNSNSSVLKTNSSTLKNTETLEGTLTEDDVSQDELMTKPYELKIKLDARLRLYLVEDEQKNLFQVKLLPKHSCICVEKGNCAHILAVQHLNGIDISNQYKLPNIAKITKAKNSGSTGRKKRGHHVNSIETNILAGDNVDDNAVAEATCDLRMRSILKQLIMEETNLDKVLSKDLKIKPSMLTTDQSKLSDVFLTQINLDKIRTDPTSSYQKLATDFNSKTQAVGISK
ncbi:hypothetical protein BpHYR1_043262 [Brachionus plicatilis]|uniref:SWIM-type domain-containing protein n=1 Tax=Brachionus plicatilis TaxID=10195 RepID=A0A3M7P9Q9_BRAPC|nr:hypothetical protein BpHYR1_043262 [Brachionus plicatilis]